MSKIVIYTDGGSRGNPGPAAAGFVIYEHLAPHGRASLLLERGVYLGKTTNNVAEYTAIKLALEAALTQLGDAANKTDLEVRLDSQLAQRQLTGKYKMKNPGLRPIFDEINKLRPQFKSVLFFHVPREDNTAADAAVNKILDQTAQAHGRM